MQLNKKISETLECLEKLDREFLIENVSSNNEVWTHNGKVKLWSIERTTGEILRLITFVKNPQIVLELGTSAGYSTIWIASGLSNKSKIFTIEMAELKVQMAKKYFSQSGLNDKIVQIEGDILNVLDSWDKKIDLVFIDADKLEYFSYIKKLEKHLSNNAIIIADNAINFAKDIKNYRAYLKKNKHYKTQLINIDDGLLVSMYNK